MYSKAVVLLLVFATVSGCTKKAKYPGKGVNPLLPSIHEQHAARSRLHKPVAHEQPGVIAVVNTPRKAFIVYTDKRGRLHHRSFSGVFVTGNQGKPELWRIERKVVKGVKDIQFKHPLMFDVLKLKDETLMSGASILAEIRDQVAHGKKDADMDYSQWQYRKYFTPFACAMDTVTYLVHQSQFLPGAAHPDALASLVTLSARTHKKVVFAKQFSLDTLLKQANARKKLDKCLSAFDAVVPVKARGGRLAWVASFNHNFLYCNGMIDYREVGPPPGSTQSGQGPCVLKKDVLTDKQGKLLARMVWDYRATDDCRVVVYIKKTGPADRYHITPRPGRTARRRNIYILIHAPAKGNKQVLLGRASRILCADFPDHRPLRDYIQH